MIQRTPDCFDDDTIAALAEGGLDPTARSALLPHLASCAWCRRAVASIAGALGDPQVAREIAAVGGVNRRRVLRFALPLAAAAVLVLLVRAPYGDRQQHRGTAITEGATPLPLEPLGTVATLGSLRWTAVPGADRYRVTLFDADGRVLYEAQGSDTSAAVPGSVSLIPGRAYFWKVDARTGFDRWTGSSLAEFRIGRGPP